MQTTTKQTGKSFNRTSNTPYLNPKKEKGTGIQIGKVLAFTSAQAMTAIAYGDCNTVQIPMRNLDFKTKCDSYQDWAKCIEIIQSYNEFDSSLILKKAPFVLNLQHFLNQDNANNGGSFFDFEIGREGSPSFYVGLNCQYHNKIIKDTEKIEATEDQPAITEIFWEEYTAEDFRANMATLAGTIKADEFSIEEIQTYGGLYLTARFWFD